MEKEFVSYEQALALKKIGFDEECLKMFEHRKICEEQAKPSGCQLHNLHCGYPDCTIDKSIVPVPLPLKSQVFRWFREKYDAHMHPSRLMRNIYVVRYGDWDSEAFKTYEEAENACIDKLIELAKQQDK